MFKGIEQGFLSQKAETMYTFRMLLPLCTLIALACGEATSPFQPDRSMAPSAATTETQVFQMPIAFFQFVPCGENINWIGELKIVVHVTTLFTSEGDLSGLHIAQSVTGSLDGTGESTGDTYTGKLSQHGPVNILDFGDSAPFNTTLVFKILVRSSTGLVGIQTVKAHTTINANGEMVVDYFDFEFKCK